MKRLHVNIDHCATVRQARGTSYPDPVTAALLAELAGAQGITAHLREDRRHIDDRDMQRLREAVRTVLNMEMAATAEMIGIAQTIRPDIVTLVPERRAEQTTEGGLDLHSAGIAAAIAQLKDSGLMVSVFIAPAAKQVAQAALLGADTVEFHTGEYCHATGAAREREGARLAEGARVAAQHGLHVAAGHGLDYTNVAPVFAIPEIAEFNIGHAIIARALFVGIDRAVRDMLALMRASGEGTA